MLSQLLGDLARLDLPVDLLTDAASGAAARRC
jgi:hypothetical protein